MAKKLVIAVLLIALIMALVPGFLSKIDECSSNPCLNGATCTDQVNGSSCTCPTGYSGTRCENNIDECSSNPCQNGGTCTDQVNSYSCTCAAGYSGIRCENNIDECSSNPCLNDGTCTDQVNSYLCTCAAGYSGTRCDNRGLVGTKIHFPYRSPISIFVYRVVQGSVSGIQKAFDNHNHDTIAKGEEFTVLVDFSSSLYNDQRQWYEISARFCYGKDIERCVNQKRPFSHPYLVRPSSVQIPVPFVVPFSKIHNASLPDGSTVNEAGTVHEQFKTFQVNGAKYDTSTGILMSFSAESPEKAGKISGIDLLRDTRRALKHQPLVQCYFVEWNTDGCVPGLDNLMNGYDVKYLELKNRPWLKVKFPEHRDDRYLKTLRIPGKGTFNYLVLKDMALKGEATMANSFSYVFASVKEQVEEVLKSIGLELKKGYFLGSGKYQSYIKHYKKQAFSAAMSGTEFRFFRATMPTSHLRDDANWDDGFNAKWKSLFKHRNNATAIDFFREYGTHYIVEAVMGGRQETLFTVNYCLLIKDKGKILDFKARLIKPYKFSSSSVGVQAYYNYLKSHSLSKMIISGPETTCTGGDSLDSEVCHNLTLWKDSLFNNPYPIRMTVRPFYTLVQGDDDNENRKWMKEMYQEYLKADLDEVEINKDITVKVKCEGREYRVRGALSMVIAGIVILELWF